MKTKFNNFINEKLEDNQTKRILQELRTELNLYKKCLNSIEYSINHKKSKLYDYGESSENILSDIKDNIETCRNNVSNITLRK